VKPLSDKQRRFVAEYLVTLNATQAAIRAGYSEKTAGSQGERLLKNAEVQKSVQAGASKRLDKLELTGNRVLEEMARLGFSDVREWFDETGRLRPLHELGDNAAKAIASIEIVREKTTRKEGETEEVTVEERVVKVRAWDKVRALEMLGKYYGLLKDRVEHTGANGAPIETRVVFGGRHRPKDATP
jgi:phage terminase small subunit